MSDLLGPASAANSVTTEPADSRTFGSNDTYFQDCTSSTAQNGTAIGASWLNGMLQQVRAAIRGMGITVSNTNSNMLLQAIQAASPPFAADSSSTPGLLTVNVNQPGFTLVGGTRIFVLIANTVPGATTMALSNGATSYGTLNVTRSDKSALNTYDMIAGGIAELIYDGTEFQLPKPYLGGSTGDVSWAAAGVSKSGYVPLNGLTIGNASSGGTALASPLAVSLFTFLWNNFANALCAVSSGRGSSAAADFAANKTIALPDWQCKTVVGVDGMGGASATGRLSGVPVTAGNAATPGSTLGEAEHTLVTAELPVITPSGTVAISGGTEGGSGTGTATGGGAASIPYPPTAIVATFTGTPFGSGDAHNNTQLTVTAVAFARL